MSTPSPDAQLPPGFSWPKVRGRRVGGGKVTAGGDAGTPAPKSEADLVREHRSAARRYSPRAIEVLASIMNDTGVSVKARVSAATEILNRAWGRPRQELELSGPDGGPIEHQVVADAEHFTRALVGLIERRREDGAAEGADE